MRADLVKRMARIIVSMRALSEVPAAQLSVIGRGSGVRSSPPPGAVLGERRDLRDLSLADYWSERFKCARTEEQFLAFIYLAERDLARANRRGPTIDPHENPERRTRRVLGMYEGLAPLEAALAEGCSEGWIRKVRSGNGYDPQSGHAYEP